MPTPSGLQLGDRLEHDARHADLVQREREADAADAATGNQYGQIGHRIRSPGVVIAAQESLDSRLARKTLRSNLV